MNDEGGDQASGTGGSASPTSLLSEALDVQGCAVFDRDLKLVYSNPHFAEIHGYPASLCRPGATLHDLLSYGARRGDIEAEDVDRMVAAELERAGASEPHEAERRLKDGRSIIEHHRPLSGGGLLVMHWDVTELSEAQEGLRQIREEAEQANHVKSVFLANMSHELRTPLNAVIGCSELLREEAEDLGDAGEIFDSDLERIHKAGKHLLSLINDVLDRNFDEFHQVEMSATRRYGGIGLGLAVCRRFCQILGGDISVTSEPGEGSEFVLDLPAVAPAIKIRYASPMAVVGLWETIKPAIEHAKYLEDVAQELAQTLHAQFEDSIVLARVFITINFGSLPPANAEFVRDLAESAGATAGLRDATPVLSLIGTRGVEQEWNDRRRSKSHVGIPLISSTFVDDIPMISRLLKDLGVPLDWVDSQEPEIIQKVIGQSEGLFFVADAEFAKDAQGRRIIVAQDFVSDYRVKSVFGIGGAYPGDEIIVIVAFCRDAFPEPVAEHFLPLASLFKGQTAALVAQGLIFSE